ncbi:MAG: hypothetical protein Fur0012_04180 [Elusimicrobiota bacterium]
MKEKITVDSCLRESMPSFIAHVRAHAENIKKLSKEKNIEEIKRLAHNIKGAGGGYGFDRISLIGAQIEEACENLGFDLIDKKAAELAVFFDEIEIVYD